MSPSTRPGGQTRHVPSTARRCAGALALVAGLATLAGCAPLIIGGALIGGSMVATDRRTSGTQVEDEVIELKAIGRLNEAFGDRARVSTTSYNRTVLLTGEVPNAADKAAAEQVVAQIDNVKAIVNELVIGEPRALPSRSGDTFITAKVKASLVDAKDLFANSIKVVTQQGTVYLLGRVTEREATRAAEVTRGVSGVRKVVKVFDVISEGELAHTEPKAVAKQP